MTQFDALLSNVKGNDNFEENTRFLQYLSGILRNAKKPLSNAEYEEISLFIFDEMRRLLTLIPETKSYKKKDEMFAYENSLLELFSLVGKNAGDLNEEQVDIIKRLVTTVSNERVLENAVDETFKQDVIDAASIEAVLKTARGINDEYQRGMLYQGLHAYKEKMSALTAEAKNMLAEYTAADMAEKISKKGKLTDEEMNNLEFAVDVCKYYVNDVILELLSKVMTLNINRISYYALETLLVNGREVSAESVEGLARDLTCAEMTYYLLEKYGKTGLFPKEYSNPEYLAKSDMVHWLTYPTELNKEPDEIQLLGSIKVKKELYYVFKYKSDSDNLSDDLKNVWLIGWSGDNGNTFSNFDKLADYEKKNPQKTLKYIAKKLLR